MKKAILLSGILILAMGCKYFAKNRAAQDERVIARVYDEFLFLSDVQPLVQGVSQEDSAKLIASYAESWVKKKLLYKKAQEYIAGDESGIEKKVEAYRQSLTLYEYEKELVRTKLDKAVNEEEINAYYEKNKGNYALENDIYLVNFVFINPESEDFEKIKPLFSKNRNEDEQRALEGYCKAYSKDYNITDGVWKTANRMTIDFLMDDAQIASLGKSEAYREFKNNDQSFFVRIADIKRNGDATPLPAIKDQIKEMLMNKKKIVLIDNIYNKILEDGLKKENVELLVK